MEKIQTNSDIHIKNKRYRYDLHDHNTNLSRYLKGVHNSGIKLNNNHPPNIKCLNHDIRIFKLVLYISYLTPPTL
jgi:hypothetical protein